MSINIFPKQVHNLFLCFFMEDKFMKSLHNCEKHFHDQSFIVRGLQALISGNELNATLDSIHKICTNHGRACTQVLFLPKAEPGIFSLFKNSERLAGTFHSRRYSLLKTGFFRQVRELKIQRKNAGSALRYLIFSWSSRVVDFFFLCRCRSQSNS